MSHLPLSAIIWAPIALAAALGLAAAATRWLGRWWRDGARRYRRAQVEAALDTRPVTRAMDLGGLVISPHQEHIAQRRAGALHDGPFDEHATQALDVARRCPWCQPADRIAILGDVRCLCAIPCGHLLCFAPGGDEAA